MKTINLTLKKKWFDMIASGEKKEEYRDIKEYWTNRFVLEPTNPEYKRTSELLIFKKFDTVTFKNGYAKDAPKIVVEFKGFSIGKGKQELGAIIGEYYFILYLGKIIKQVDEL